MPEKSNPIAVIEMAAGGCMRLELYPGKAPITVANFVDLARAGYYNGLSFHRVVEGFVIQGGSKTNTCEGDNPGFSIKGEFSENGVDTGLDHRRGALSMARDSNPDSAATQFFIVHEDAHRLDGKYAAFGMLAEGFDVLDAIATAPTLPPEQDNKPLQEQTIKTISIEPEDYGNNLVERIR